MINKLTRILGNFLILTISVVISLVIAEFVLRYAMPLDRYEMLQHRKPHPVLGWVLEPDASYVNQLPEAEVKVKYNSVGWRDDEHSIQAEGNVFRVLVLGDSFIEAYSVELDEAFHKQLQRVAGENEIDIEVLNLGVGGYGTLQEYLAFRDIGSLYKPDLVLLGFYLGNDVRNNHFELESIANAGSAKVNTRPFLLSSKDDIWQLSEIAFSDAQRRWSEEKNRSRASLKSLAKDTAIWKLVSSGLTTLGTWSLEPPSDQVGQAHAKRMQLALYGANYCNEPPEYIAAWKSTERILTRLSKVIRDSGSRLVVFSVPSMFESNLQEAESLLSRLGNPDAICFGEAPGYDRLQRIVVSLGIEYVDLLPPFRAAISNGDRTLFRPSDRHWNPEGHALAAEAVFAFLLGANIF